MSAVALVGIEKRFGRRPVLAAIDLDIADGEFMVVVGPSGCGKSTLLRIVAGLEQPDRGDVIIGGERVTHRAPAQRGVAMVFQSYALYPHMTAFANMSFGLEQARASRTEIERKVRWAADVLRISHLLERKPRELSGGERQRVAIGRAITREPGVFLLDEPLSNLDAGLRGHMRAELIELHRSLKVTTIHVTHDQVEAMTLADRIAVLRDGKIEQVGPPLSLYRRPANRFVGSFIGAPQMNFIPVELQGREGKNLLVRLPGGAELRIPGEGEPRLSQTKSEGSGLEIGVRPEHLIASERGKVDLQGRIRLVEHLGSATLLHVRCSRLEADLRIQMPGTVQWLVGQEIAIEVPVAECTLFDSAGRAIA